MLCVYIKYNKVVFKLGVNDFQQEVIESLATIKAEVKYINKLLEKNQDTTEKMQSTITQQGERITANEQRSRSAHHRIDGIYATAGMFGAAAGWLADFVPKMFNKG